MNSQHIYDAVILGAGFGGLGMGAQLKRANIDNFIIFEKAHAIGGTWRDNTYPNAACDIPARLYCYSFYPNIAVSEAYAGQAELFNYITEFSTHFGLNEKTHLNKEITEALWNEDDHLWHVTLNTGETYYTRSFLTAWGHLSEPSIPNLNGMESFKGVSFHSARWNHDIDLTDKIIATIGSAASAVQFVPAIAKIAKQLTVYQRTPNWIRPRMQETFDPDEIAAFKKNPALYDATRKAIHDYLEDNFTVFDVKSNAQKKAIEESLAYLESEVSDPVLRKKLTPNYAYGCKRVLRTSDYYAALTRDNVYLETSPISQVTEDGIITNDGGFHPAEVIIFGTGFQTQRFQGDLNITGLKNIRLADAWQNGQRAEAYLGITIPNFPNMFLLMGPNTGLGHNSMITMMEIQQTYIIQALQDILTTKNRAISVKKAPFTSFIDTLQSNLQHTAFSAGCTSWYQNNDGRLIAAWSGSIHDYEETVATYDPHDYHRIEENKLC